LVEQPRGKTSGQKSRGKNWEVHTRWTINGGRRSRGFPPATTVEGHVEGPPLGDCLWVTLGNALGRQNPWYPLRKTDTEDPLRGNPWENPLGDPHWGTPIGGSLLGDPPRGTPFGGPHSEDPTQGTLLGGPHSGDNSEDPTRGTPLWGHQSGTPIGGLH
jgi:hypothetical protein